MKTKLIKPTFFLYGASKTKLPIWKAIGHKCFTISLLLFCTVFTVVKGQTVNYSYDSSGNVISKQVIDFQSNTTFNSKTDSIGLSNQFFMSVRNTININSEDISINSPNKSSGNVAYSSRIAFCIKQVPVIPRLLCYRIHMIEDREKNNSPN